MARDDAIVVVDQDWIGPSELLQTLGDLADLHWRMRSRIARIWLQRRDRALPDLESSGFVIASFHLRLLLQPVTGLQLIKKMLGASTPNFWSLFKKTRGQRRRLVFGVRLAGHK